MTTQLLEATEALESLEGIETKEESFVVRELPVEDWTLLQEAFLSQGDILPDPNSTTIFVAVNPTTNKILGFLALQSVVHIHAEPLFIYPEAQGLSLHKLLYDVVDLQLQIGKEVMGIDKLPYFITLKDEKLIKRAKERGFKEVDVRLFSKEL